MDKSYFSYRGSNRKGSAIAGPTASALKKFCDQEPEFSQAIEQSGKTFTECIDEVASKLAGYASDIEVYTKAVQFYFQTATINVEMTINTAGTVEEAAEKLKAITDLNTKENEDIKERAEKAKKSTQVEEKPKSLKLSLDDLLDF